MEMEINHRPINWLTSLVISKWLCKFVNCNCNYWHVNKQKSAAEKKNVANYSNEKLFSNSCKIELKSDTPSQMEEQRDTRMLATRRHCSWSVVASCKLQLSVAAGCRPVLEAGRLAGSCQSVWRFWPNRVKTVENDKRHIANSWSLEQMQAFQLQLFEMSAWNGRSWQRI